MKLILEKEERYDTEDEARERARQLVKPGRPVSVTTRGKGRLWYWYVTYRK
jgi:hypothetical protein